MTRLARAQATRAVPVAHARQSVDEVRTALAGQRLDAADDVAVLDGASLVGIVPIERLLEAGRGVRIEEIMDGDPPIVTLDTELEEVLRRGLSHGEATIAVVDPDGTFAGLVPAERLLGILLAEHDEDVARIGGYLASTRRARQAAEETVGRRLWHRLPWLLMGLGGAVASAAIIGAFEEAVSNNVLLAFFVPGVVYMAAAIGTQTQAVLIRGLSVGVPLSAVFGRELASGVVLSLVVGAALLPVALAGWGDADVAVAVAVALFASSVVSVLIAVALPWCLERLGSDPAFGSGPLATVLQDLATIVIYFAVAVALVD